MTIRLSLSGLLLLASVGCSETPEPSEAPVPASADSSYGVVFFDDFDSGSLDRSKWNVVGQDFWVNQEVQIYIDSTWTIGFHQDLEGAENGALALTARWSEGWTAPRGRVSDIVSGRINTRDRFDFLYGRAEARLRMPAAEGLWPAFWALGYGRWPGSGEIDIMEYVGEPDWIGVALHGPGYSGETPIVNKFFFPEGQDVTDWHVYAVDWTPDQVDFYVDDRLIYRVTRPMVEHYGDWRFDNPKYLILNTAVGGMYPYKTNGIDEPYFGLPQHTVDTIRESGLAMEVDWVRVTRDPARHPVR